MAHSSASASVYCIPLAFLPPRTPIVHSRTQEWHKRKHDIAHHPLITHKMSRPAVADNLPPTARSIALLLASTPTVQDAQPGVLHQLLEFSHRYTTQVLSDALVYSEHAGRAGKIDMDDVVLAVQARVGWEFGGRVPKEVRTPSLLPCSCSLA